MLQRFRTRRNNVVVMVWLDEFGFCIQPIQWNKFSALQRQGQYVAAQEILDDLVLEHNTPVIQFEWARNL